MTCIQTCFIVFAFPFWCLFTVVENTSWYHHHSRSSVEFGNHKHVIALVNDPQLTITNDGPTMRGAETTYYAKLSHTTPDFEYTCFWAEFKCGKLLPSWQTEVTDSGKCNTSSHYDCIEDLGNHTMSLYIIQNNDPVKEVAEGNSVVVITEHINAKFEVVQEGTVCNNTSSTCALATNKSMQMIVDLHDPSNFFQGASIVYSWLFGDGTSYVGLQPTVFHNYSSAGLHTVSVNMTAVLSDEDSTEKFGFVTYPIQLLDSISNLTIKGTSDTEMGSSVQYNVSCNGSVPVSFCWSMTHHSQDNNSYTDNTTCIWTLSSESCKTSIKYKFNNTGTYHLKVKATNDVSLQVSERNINVKNAHIAAYSSIAVALVFGILFSLLSIAVVVHSYRKERMRHVEVANFDFQAENSSDSFSNFTRRLRYMVTPPPSSREEQMKLLQNRQVASELDVL